MTQIQIFFTCESQFGCIMTQTHTCFVTNDEYNGGQSGRTNCMLACGYRLILEIITSQQTGKSPPKRFLVHKFLNKLITR